MLTQALTISLIITAIHASMWDGMIFHFVAFFIDTALDLPPLRRLGFLRKPLYECLICMGGVWTVVLYPLLYGWAWQLVPVMLCVIGINTIISEIIKTLR